MIEMFLILYAYLLLHQFLIDYIVPHRDWKVLNLYMTLVEEMDSVWDRVWDRV